MNMQLIAIRFNIKMAKWIIRLLTINGDYLWNDSADMHISCVQIKFSYHLHTRLWTTLVFAFTTIRMIITMIFND